jgi:peptidoglycan/LPS O-acetylase OafA/YrhL
LAAPAKADRNLGLDMIRALGVILVMAAHYGNNFAFWFGIKGGFPRALYAGTLAFEFFFVMSGFLIGRLLMDIAREAPTWRNLFIFLIRRWLRTLPLYYVWLILLLIVFPPPDHVLHYALMFATMTQNFWHPMPENFFYAVSWSLGIEEWFYILFGTSVVVCARLFGARAAIWGPTLVFIVVPPILRLSVPGYSDWMTGLAKVSVFRLDEIAYGVLMAELYVRRSWLFRHPLPPFCAGAAMIALYRSVVPPNLFFPFAFSDMALGSALCLPMVLRLQQAPKWLEFLGRRISAQSYGLYIMHLTILVELVQQSLLGPRLIGRWTAVALAITLPFALSYISFRFFEAPILALRPRQRLGRATSQ